MQTRLSKSYNKELKEQVVKECIVTINNLCVIVKKVLCHLLTSKWNDFFIDKM